MSLLTDLNERVQKLDADIADEEGYIERWLGWAERARETKRNLEALRAEYIAAIEALDRQPASEAETVQAVA